MTGLNFQSQAATFPIAWPNARAFGYGLTLGLTPFLQRFSTIVKPPFAKRLECGSLLPLFDRLGAFPHAKASASRRTPNASR